MAGFSYLYAASFRPAGTGGGIYGFRWRLRGKRLEPLGKVSTGIENPLCQLVSPDGRYLYVADCTADWRSGGAVYSHRIDPASGGLETCGAVDSAGLIPVSLTVAGDGRNVFVANCGPYAASDDGRTVAVFPVKPQGILGPAKTIQQHRGSSADPQRQTSAHPHGVTIDPDNGYAWVPDLGTDSIWCYAYHAALGALLLEPERTVQLTANSGPRTLKFHPNGKFAYLINELASTLVSYAYIDSQLHERQLQSTLAAADAAADGAADQERHAADMVVHPNGGSLYVSNRAQHTITAFKLNPETGDACCIGHVDSQGRAPRGMVLDASGGYLLVGNEDSGSIQGFRIVENGTLKSIGALAEMPGPACLTFAPA